MGDTYDDWEGEGGSIRREASDDAEAIARAREQAQHLNEVVNRLEEEKTEDGSYDPLDGERGTRVATLITLMRLYDVQLALLSEKDDNLAERIMSEHGRGNILASFPELSL